MKIYKDFDKGFEDPQRSLRIVAFLHEYFVKMLNRPSFTFHGESKQVTTKFSVSFSGL